MTPSLKIISFIKNLAFKTLIIPTVILQANKKDFNYNELRIPRDLN